MSSYNSGGGGGGTPISIFFQIVGIDQIKAALASLPGEFAKIDAAAKASGVDLSALMTNFKGVGTAATSGLAPASQGLQKLGQDEATAGQNTQKLTQTMQQQGAAAEGAGAALTGTGEAANTAGAGMDKANQSFTTASEGASNLSNAQGTVQSSLQGTGEAVVTVSSGLEQYNTVQQTTTTTGETLANSENTVKQSLDSTGQSIITATSGYEGLSTAEQQKNTVSEQTVSTNEQLITSSEGVSTAQQQEAGTTGEVATGLKNVDTASSGTAASAGTLTSKFNETTASLGKGAGAMEQSANKAQTLKESFEKSIAPMSAIIASGVSLFQSFESITAAQTKAAIATTRAGQADLIVEKAQLAYNTAVEKFGPNSEQATIALTALNLDKQKASEMDAKAELSQTNLNETMINFAESVIPNALSLISNLGSAWDIFGKGLKQRVIDFKAASVAAVETGASTKILGVEVAATSRTMALAGLTNPFFLALTVGGALVAAFATNLGGFRDMINGVGVALGKAFPPLKGFLDMLSGAGKFITQTLGIATDDQKAYAENTKTSMEGAAASYETLKTNATKSIDDLAKFLVASNAKIAEDRANLDKILSGKTPAPEQGPEKQGPPKPGDANIPSADQLKGANLGSAYADILASSKALTMQNGLLTGSFTQVKNSLLSAGQPAKYIDQTMQELGKNITWVTTSDTGLTTATNAQTGSLTTNSAAVSKVSAAAAQKALADDIAAQKAQVLQQATDALTKTNTGLEASIASETATLGSSAAMQLVVQGGVLKATEAMKSNEIAVISNIAGQQEYGKQLQTTEGQTLAFNEGVLKMVTQLNATKAAIPETAGELAALNAAMADGSAQADALTAGFEKQVLASKKNTLAVSDLHGQTLALFGSYKSGQAAVTAFQTGLENEEQAMYNNNAAMYENAAAVKKMQQDYYTGIPTITAYGNGIVAQAKFLEDLKLATDQARGSNDQYDSQIKDNTIQIAQYNSGIQEQRKNLDDLIANTAKANGVNKQFSAQLADNTMQVAKFAEGQTAADTALNELNASTAKGNGTLAEYVTHLKDNSEQSAQFSAGLLDIQTKMENMVGETAKMVGQFAGLNAALTDVVASNIEYANGVAQGKEKTAEMALEMTNAKGVYVGTNDVLVQLAQSYGLGDTALKSSNKALTDYIGVMRGAPDAVQGLIDKLAEFADSASTKIADAMGKGKGAVKNAIKEIETDLGRTLTKPEVTTLKLQADTSKAVTSIQDDLSLAFAGVARGSAESVASSIDAAMKVAQEHITTATGPIKGAWQAVWDSLSAIKADPLDKSTMATSAAKIADALSTMGIKGQNAIDFVKNLNLPADQASQVLSQLSGNVGATGQAATTASPQLQAFYQTLAGFGALETVAQSVFEQGLPGIIAGAAPKITAAITQMFAGALPASTALLATLTSIGASFTALTTIVTTGAQAMNVAFGSLNALQPSFLASLTSVATSMQMLGPAVNQAVINANTYFGSLNALQPPFLASLTSVATAMQQLGPAVNQAVINANTYFASLSALQPAFTVTLNTLITSLIQIAPAVNQSVIAANTYFASLSALQPAFLSSLVAAEGQVALIAPAVNQAVVASNIFFAQLGSNLPPVFATIQTSAAAAFNNVTISASSTAQAVPPMFSSMEVAIQGVFNKLQTDAGNAFIAITNIAKQQAPAINPPFTTAAGKVNTDLGTIAVAAAKNFGAVTTESGKAATNVKTQLPGAFSTVTSAASSMASSVDGSFLHIAAAAQTATNSVRTLQGSIDNLHDKTVTITYKQVTVGSAPSGYASGIAPMIVDHPMNITVGESGREFVQVTPIKGNGDRNLSVGQQLAKGADPGNVGFNNVRMANGLNNINDQYDYNYQSYSNNNGVIKQDSVNIASSNGPNNQNYQYQNNTGGNISGGSGSNSIGSGGPTSAGSLVSNPHDGFIPLVVTPHSRPTGNANFAKLIPGASFYPGTDPHNGSAGSGDGNPPSNPPPNNGGGNGNPPPPPPPPPGNGNGGSGGGLDLHNLAGLGDAINKMVQSILEKAFSNTILNVNNNNYIDGKKVYDSQQRYFNLRSGALLK